MNMPAWWWMSGSFLVYNESEKSRHGRGNVVPVHRVKQGECLNTIADQYGFFWETLWNHAKNADLKALRKNPAVLHPGDEVFIPELRQKEEAAATTKVHTFRLKGVPVKLRLHLLDSEGKARAQVKYTLTVDGQEFTGTTAGDGEICRQIPPRAKSGSLKLETGEQYALDLGYVDPVEYTSGVQARLGNLAYYFGEVTGSMDDETSDAISDFQRAKGLPETGEADQATKDALVAAHGS